MNSPKGNEQKKNFVLLNGIERSWIEYRGWILDESRSTTETTFPVWLCVYIAYVYIYCKRHYIIFQLACGTYPLSFKVECHPLFSGYRREKRAEGKSSTKKNGEQFDDGIPDLVDETPAGTALCRLVRRSMGWSNILFFVWLFVCIWLFLNMPTYIT